MMPLLSSKFALPKIGARKSRLSNKNKDSVEENVQEEDLSSNIPDEITLAPEGLPALVFEGGVWTADSDVVPAGSRRDNSKLKEKLQKLEEENNLLRIKLEVVMDILTETTAQSHLQEKELQQLRAALLKSKKK